ncbi:MAG: TetR/AcrR family transcriptional regulator [Piscinibacter sp.]|uniref:TetR/AcrR family transcriptional regulator n=1 Tax=Piscinibacter TaxID=1114981 RepID=UPI0013E305D8|nr:MULTISPECIES: TetR/AcrR family transcriptional regulator [Piscinibacter]MCW5664987.1 TetR/AcrR family transcriptional regulator [Piscinibacter sp.]
MARPPTDVPARILAAAEPLFAELGFSGCSLLRIAKAAGTSESGVLRFYASKEDVFFAVIEAALAELHDRIDAALAAPDAPPPEAVVERLVLLLRVVFDMYAAHPDKAALVFSEGGLSVYMLRGSAGRTLMTLPGMLRLVERVDALFAQGCRRGPFVGIDPVAGREAWFGIVEGAILGWLLASAPEGHYSSASARKILNVARKMLLGLTLP